MATGTSAPLPNVFPVRNPFKVSLQDPLALSSDNLDPTEVEVIVEVEDIRGSDIFRKVGEMINPYAADNFASAIINRCLLGALKATPPNITATGLTEYGQICKKFRIRVRDLIGGVPSGAFVTIEPAHAWLAGNSFQDNATNPAANRAYRILWTQSSNRFLHPNQSIFLPFLTFQAGTDIQLRINARYTDDTTEIFETPLGNLTAFTNYGITVPRPVWTKELDYFTISLGGFFGGSAEAINVRLLPASQYSQQVFYLNSFGGYENFIFTGKSEFSFTTTSDSFEANLHPGSSSNEGNYTTFNEKLYDSVTLRSGYIKPSQLIALKDMVLRNEVYLVQGTNLRKLKITNATYPQRKDGEFLFSIEIQARFAYDHVALSRA